MKKPFIRDLLRTLTEVDESRFLDIFSREEIQVLLVVLRDRQKVWDRSNERAAERRRAMKEAISEARAKARLGDADAEAFLKRLGVE